jgi:hypothetical protein
MGVIVAVNIFAQLSTVIKNIEDQTHINKSIMQILLVLRLYPEYGTLEGFS